MMDTLLVGDYILVNKFLYGPELPLTDHRLPGFRHPARGDIIVFKYPQDEKRDFIKRIIGTPATPSRSGATRSSSTARRSWSRTCAASTGRSATARSRPT